MEEKTSDGFNTSPAPFSVSSKGEAPAYHWPGANEGRCVRRLQGGSLELGAWRDAASKPSPSFQLGEALSRRGIGIRLDQNAVVSISVSTSVASATSPLMKRPDPGHPGACDHGRVGQSCRPPLAPRALFCPPSRIARAVNRRIKQDTNIDLVSSASVQGVGDPRSSSLQVVPP